MTKTFDRKLANKIQMVLFLFFGVTNLWLWYVGHANIIAAIAGVAFLAGSIMLAWQIRYKKS